VGALQVRTTDFRPGLATTLVGAPGTVRGVAETLDELAPVPAALVAAIRNWYPVPFVSPETVRVRLSGAELVTVVQVVPLVDLWTR
jgi:hypothetical protein